MGVCFLWVLKPFLNCYVYVGMTSLIEIVGLVCFWVFVFAAWDKVIWPILNKRKVTIVYKVDYSLKYAYETNDEFIERAFRECLGSYKIIGYHIS